MPVTVTVLGGDKLLRKLTVMPEAMKERVRVAMAKEADEIVEMMKSLAPVLKKPESGRVPGALRDSIGWTWGPIARKRAMKLGTMASKKDPTMLITFFAGGGEVFWHWWQEVGTVKDVARPFFFVSWRANKKGARNAIRKAVRDAAKQVAAT